MADGIPDAERAALARRCAPRGRRRLSAGAAALQGVHRRDYRPKAPDAAGLASYPGGARYYEFLIRSRIIRGRRREQIHELGLAEVKRLRAEIGAIAKEVGFKGTTDEFIEHMRTDPKYFFDSAGRGARRVSGDAAARRPAAAEALPQRAAHALRGARMTPAEAASSTAANYQVGSLDARHERLFHDQRARLRERGEMAVGDALPARGRAGPSHADRARRGDRGSAPVALAGELQHRLRRGLGALCGVARLRHRLLQGSVPALRQPARRGSSAPRGSSSIPAFTPTTGRATRRSRTWPAGRRRPGVRGERGGPLFLEPRRRRSAT